MRRLKKAQTQKKGTDRLYSQNSIDYNGSRKSNYSVPNRLNSNNSSACYQKPKFYTKSPMNQEQIQKKPSPSQPYVRPNQKKEISFKLIETISWKKQYCQINFSTKIKLLIIQSFIIQMIILIINYIKNQSIFQQFQNNL
ncbi:unnamed protein product [Paramecium sonneborni]|uniref:Transmembrane protein n=1 Tax=Paramecium sonneborni TaxID=65129 RepID=A0A8S1MBG6_9CILI|nr:unnamed protein product [Paramecium sonneborni]